MYNGLKIDNNLNNKQDIISAIYYDGNTLKKWLLMENQN